MSSEKYTAPQVNQPSHQQFLAALLQVSQLHLGLTAGCTMRVAGCTMRVTTELYKSLMSERPSAEILADNSAIWASEASTSALVHFSASNASKITQRGKKICDERDVCAKSMRIEKQVFQFDFSPGKQNHLETACEIYTDSSLVFE